ncbi:MAG: membrane integrity-associated transporter subunit PqiC [Proteobacteria bacterium]|mgnify:CR=1 FL=1|jgi:uncharacterized protein|nr:membrane integrity-associated transporter subunit PqiC [Pseudomonadota bacterium]
MTLIRHLQIWFSLAVAVLMVSACGGTATPPPNFFVLSTPDGLEAERPAKRGSADLSLGIGPIILPPHLDRPQIVTKSTRHKLDLDEFNQWAEPLKDNFTRILAENLSILLGTDRIAIYPWRSSVPVGYQVAAEVVRFDGQLGGNSTLIVRWNVFGKGGREILFSRRSVYTVRSSGNSFEAMVSAMSDSVAAFSREIAAATGALEP